jgi:hypothetical protein
MLSRNLAHFSSKDSALIVVAFTRPVNDDEMDCMRLNFKNGDIKTDPDKNLEQAVLEQHVLELQEAYDVASLAGDFNVLSVQLGRATDPKHLGPIEQSPSE